jgi:hypothetical protein
MCGLGVKQTECFPCALEVSLAPQYIMESRTDQAPGQQQGSINARLLTGGESVWDRSGSHRSAGIYKLRILLTHDSRKSVVVS